MAVLHDAEGSINIPLKEFHTHLEQHVDKKIMTDLIHSFYFYHTFPIPCRSFRESTYFRQKLYLGNIMGKML